MDNLETYRKEINTIDEQILSLLGKRFALVKKIGEHKKANTIAIVDKSRESEIIEALKEKAKEHNLSESFITDIWQIFFREAQRVESR